jgi:5-methylcytosine-specific restriction endonuclease McrA
MGEVHKSESNNNRRCLCRCNECGKEKDVLIVDLYTGRSNCTCTTEENKKEQARIRSARYYALHPDRSKASSKKSREGNLEERKLVEREYRRTHKEQYRVHCTVRRTRKTKAGGAYTSAQWIALCDKYYNKCLCCNKKRKLTADHVIPVSKGGTSDISNIQPLCGPCNSSKGAKTTDYRKDSE